MVPCAAPGELTDTDEHLMQFASLLDSLRPLLDANFHLRRKNLERVSPFVEGDIVELGVGGGPDRLFFKSLPGVRSYRGCDREEYATTYIRGDRPDEIVYYRGARFPFDDASFDTALSIDCAEHIAPEDLPSYFDEIARVLRPKGRLVMSAPFIYPEHCTPYDYQRYTRYGLEQYAARASFETKLVTARSTTLETFLVMLNHRFFNGTFPHVFVKHFGVAEKGSLGVEALKALALPVTASAYSLGSAAVFACAAFGERFRDASAFSLGYTLVFEKSA